MLRRDVLRGALGWLGRHALPLHAVTAGDARELTLFVCGDVMLGRGVDQIQEHASDPKLYEAHASSALDYVALAENAHGALPRAVAPAYVWGDALAELARIRPAARIVNLETALTKSAAAWPGKGIHYRMHPANVAVLAAAHVDCCALANNHVLDWGREGLLESLDVLRGAGIRCAGAGADARSAAEPAVLPVGERSRVLVFAFATPDCGVAPDWAATDQRAGVELLSALTPEALETIASRVRAVKRPGDVAIASIHWGGNWGYAVPEAQRSFAHALIDRAQIDLVHGHSSHHPKGLELYGGRLVLYGCGDFLSDYEGIRGHEQQRPELGAMYFPTLDARTGELVRLELTPTRVRRFRIERAAQSDARWLAATLDRESRALGARIALGPEGTLTLAR